MCMLQKVEDETLPQQQPQSVWLSIILYLSKRPAPLSSTFMSVSPLFPLPGSAFSIKAEIWNL